MAAFAEAPSIFPMRKSTVKFPERCEHLQEPINRIKLACQPLASTWLHGSRLNCLVASTLSGRPYPLSLTFSNREALGGTISSILDLGVRSTVCS